MEALFAVTLGVLSASGVYLLLRGRTFPVVLGLTLLSNMAAGILDQPLSEQEVLDAAAAIDLFGPAALGSAPGDLGRSGLTCSALPPVACDQPPVRIAPGGFFLGPARPHLPAFWA